MQLDRTEIVIRQRSPLELLDLSIFVLREHLLPVVLSSLTLGAPLLLCDVFFASHWISTETQESVSYDTPFQVLQIANFFNLVLLFWLQLEFITLPITIYLGNAIFFERLGYRQILSQIRAVFVRSLIVLGILRFGLAGLIVELCFLENPTSYIKILLLIALLMSVMICRSGRPFADEIIGLEKCKLRNPPEGELSYGQRSSNLHRFLVAENFNRMVVFSTFAVLLLVMVLANFIFIKGVLSARWNWDGWIDYAGIPIALWLVSLLAVVFRFLSYLDSRIRLEGWELELRIKAEARRFMQRIEPAVVGLDLETSEVADPVEAELS
ncbi:MAG: hypothetical protein KDB03_25690 [Planctomycetales bacterium]|nr:hypothetical protein [Planctomycetales bacterium]